MDWWGIAAILVIGIVVVVYGYIDDRRRTRERDAAMAAPPKRDIPRFEPDAEPPRYLSELEARTRPAGLPSPELSDADRTALKRALGSAPSIGAGIANDRFVTDSPSGWAVADQPLVASFADPVDTVRELLPLLEKAQRNGRSLVLAAPRFSAEVLDTLAANTVQGKAHCLPVVVTADQSAQVTEHTLAEPLSHTDLQAGWVPDDHLGTVDRWVADRGHSWLLSS